MVLETAWVPGRKHSRHLPLPGVGGNIWTLFQIHLSLLEQQMGNHSSTNKLQLDISKACFLFPFPRLRRAFFYLSLSRVARLGNPHQQLLQCDLFLTR